ncbi:MAG: hypothetical protein H0U43_07205 [Chthoniobacterales bacterium]|nr:hypothetical protein [Chthoniobacterales bacterium]
MRIIPNDGDSARLLNTVVPDIRAASANDSQRASQLKRGGFWGNGVAIFIGLAAAVLIVGGATWLHERRVAADRAAAMTPVLLPTSTDSVSSSEEPLAAPAPIMVQISADDIRVSAISLGHPRLAVINGQQVSEGDFVTVHTPTVRVEVKLKVVKIADGEIHLSDGSQTMVARLRVPEGNSKTP